MVSEMKAKKMLVETVVDTAKLLYPEHDFIQLLACGELTYRSLVGQSLLWS